MKKISAFLLSLTTALTVSVCASAELADPAITYNDTGITTSWTEGKTFSTGITEAGEEATMLVFYTSSADGNDVNTDSIKALDQKSTEDGAATFDYTLKGDLEVGFYKVRVGGSSFETAKSSTITVDEQIGETFDESETDTTVTAENPSVGAVGTIPDVGDSSVYCGVVLESIETAGKDPLTHDIFFPVYNAKGGIQTAIAKNGKFNVVLTGLYSVLPSGNYKVTSYYTSNTTVNGIDDVTKISGSEYTFTVAEKPEE